ncbi:MAG: cytosol aminopeptidase, partial [Deltaproteobacteria bacterium]|nr:cytosol aminopeptidase [Deltaproteobacteria bacterium]
MDIQVERGAADGYACGLLLLFSFDSPEDWEGPVTQVDQKWGGFLSTLMKQGDFKGELFETRLLYTHGVLPAQRVLLTGLGKKAEFDLEKWRGASS